MKRFTMTILALLTALSSGAWARTDNGNDVALYLSEARTPSDQKSLISDAMGRPHYFRYLRIMTIEEGETNGLPCMAFVTEEPASYMKVAFTISKPVSMKTLKEAPPSMIGDAIAVSGKIAAVDLKRQLITLRPVIVRHKDRLTPKIGKEMLYELDPSAICYSFTAVKPGVQLPYKHRDLLDHKAEILEKQGKQAWADFLRSELAKRKQAERP
ncbi:MAG: hypothetical protein HQ523_00340 [Lentisphaerae bacterium]|nr:hypothetical protein [Lentisphaerota bacterium]